MNKRKVIGVIGSLLAALVGTLVLVGYVNSKDAAEVKPEVTAQKLVVVQPIKAGTAATALEGAVIVKPIPVSGVLPGSVASTEELKDLVASIDLVPGEQVLLERFTTAQERSRGEIPPGLLTVTIDLPPERALGGRIQPGFKVAVLGSFAGDDPTPAQTQVLMHQVLVTAVQASQRVDEDGDQGQRPDGGLLITFATDISGVERLTFTQQNGTLWLANEPEEAPTAGEGLVSRDNVFR